MRSHWKRSEIFYDIFEYFEPPSKNFLATPLKSTKYYIENICHQFLILQIIYVAEYIVVIHWISCSILKPKSLSFTCSHSFSFVFICWTTPCYLLPFVITSYITYSYSLSFIVIRCHSLSLVVICCDSLSHSLWLVVIRCHSLLLVVICCHSLYHSLSLVVTRCNFRLSFYK